MNLNTIPILVGDGWGAIAAYKGLKSEFSEIKVFTTDKSFKAILSRNEYMDNIEGLSDSLIICAGYKKIIDKDLLSANTFINIHYSLLPKYRGLHSTVWSILNGEKYLGLSIHLMNEFIDDGDIIYQHKVKNDLITSAPRYMELFNEFLENNLGEIIERFVSGQLSPVKQDKSKATWVGKRNLNDCKINFSRSNSYLNAFFRCLQDPYPLPFFEHKGAKIEVVKFSIHSVKCHTHIGRVLNIDNEGIWVKIKEGYLVVNEMRDEDGNIYSQSNFRIGQKLND